MAEHNYVSMNGNGKARGNPVKLAAASPREVIEELREINHELAQRIAKGETRFPLAYDPDLDIYAVPEP